MRGKQDPGGITRREFLEIGTAGAVVAAAGPALAQPAQQPPRAKGPRVWLDLDQKELDDAYDQSVYAPNQPQITGRYATNSEITRARLGAPRRCAYGSAPVEGLDVFTAKRRNAPINIFVHGGAWRGGLARNYAFPAESFVSAGANFVVLDFSPVQDFAGNLSMMAEQVRRAVAWVHRNAKEFDLPADTVKGGLLCGGMYDLKPVRLSARSSYVKFTDEMEHALSTQRHLDRLNCPVVVAHGTLETPEFQRQTRDFAAAVKAAGKPAQLLVAQGYNHFEIFETLANPYGLLGRAALEQTKLVLG